MACTFWARHVAIFAVATMTMLQYGAVVEAATPAPTDYRILGTDDKFKETRQVAVAFNLPAPQRLRARHIELATGAIFTPNEIRPFVSLGPKWRLPIAYDRLFVDFGFSPTIVAGSSLNGRDLGGNFHFTSSIAIGSRFGSLNQYSLSLRVQHTSNGGLNSTNPGLDLVGLNFFYDFRL